MEVAMPMTGSAMDCYEDMFKEITRKLYGEDGLPELNTNDRLAGQDRGLTPIDYDVDTPILKPEEHLTAFGLAALMQNGFSPTGILNANFQSHKPSTSNGNCNGNSIVASGLEDKWVTSEDNLQWTQSKIATYNPVQKLFRCTECDCVGYLPRVSEHWLGTHSNLRAFHCSQCPYESAWARCVRMHLSRQHNINTDESCDILTKNNPVLKEINSYLQRLKNKLDSNCNKSVTNTAQMVEEEFHPSVNSNALISSNIAAGGGSGSSSSNSSGNGNNLDQSSTANKRYSCTYCPYATDRRDLFTRHENIHREEKPFQCYVCQKQFNRADHVKKHFLRMHREHPYDLNRIRRHPPKNASGMSYYQKYNSTSQANTNESLTTTQSISSLSIPNGYSNLTSRNQSTTNARITNDGKSNVTGGKTGSSIGVKNGGCSSKKKGEKRFTCCYCSWSGVDNWCLKRHMNTHLKPFVCGLCDYKAARSERLATHVLKVHNKRACGKCSFLADDLTQLTNHQQEHHPLEHRNRSTGNNVLRTSSFNNGSTSNHSPSATTCSTISNSAVTTSLKVHELSAAAALLQAQQQSNRFLQNEAMKSWKVSQSQSSNHQQQQQQQQQQHTAKQHGAARLFNYMEASDGSEAEAETESRGAEDMCRVNLSHRIQSDFHEAGDVGGHQDEENSDEMELPLFFCSTCGCEFEDDMSLETHQFTHRHSTTSPAKSDDSKENVDPKKKYKCCLCDANFDNQSGIMSHMLAHSSLLTKPPPNPQLMQLQLEQDLANQTNSKSRRKQSRPKKIVLPFWDTDEVEVLRHLNGKLRKWRNALTNNKEGCRKLADKYMAQLVTRRGLSCIYCKNNGLSRYHTRGSLAFHYFWRHAKKRFKCEHCSLKFRHKYQCVLHSSRVHSEENPSAVETISAKENPPAVLAESSACSSQDSTNPYFTNPQTVPDQTSVNTHKLGMSFFDHTFIHTQNVFNNHMPIIIPTFPPS
ncbi:unnamed protein product [Brassicogethes aeneus]|uniref:C2H2-type domain-containing protein n=1 Tax=Brassicogethes aeneus TaxID=1431903 RepID=A0A9P0BFL6_BRAAE|nr:unnamed protein product [Brassicogethes aeneus]